VRPGSAGAGEGVSIRPATPADLRALLGLYDQLAGERSESRPAGGAEAARILAAVLADPGRSLLVATIGDRVVATADLLVVVNLTHGGRPWALVENVVVDEGHRRGGIGATLVREVERRARDAGCYKLQLLSRATRRDAHAFYEALGFERSAEGFRKYFDAPTSPAS
jgi:GNAT superfamily N-acetyltransferase